jgi:short-subunit dehydrogenase
MRLTRLMSSVLLAGGAALGALYLHNQRQRAGFDWFEKVVVITGGSRGLGLCLAREVASRGAKVALLARDMDELMKAQTDLIERGVSGVMCWECDVRDRESVQAAIEAVHHEYGRVDVLINGAGVINVGPLKHMSLDDFGDAMQTHFWGPLHTIHAVTPLMRMQGGGRIVNIASVGGKISVPHLAAYSASKAALVGLSNALRTELAAQNIWVTTAMPGPMRTGGHVNAQYKGKNHEEFTWFALVSSLPVLSMDARVAARQIVDAVQRGDATVVVPPALRASLVLNELLPEVMAKGLRWFHALLPQQNLNQPEGDAGKTGWESQSAWAPSVLTRMQDKAVEANNELKGHAPLVKPDVADVNEDAPHTSAPHSVNGTDALNVN